MSDRELRERIREVTVPGEREAEERSWRVVEAAFAERAAVRPTRMRARARVALAAAAIALLGLALPATGAGDWLRDLVRPGRDHARPALSSVPGGGRLLVTSADGPWIVRPDGSKRLLGRYDEASWSPHGLFVVATQGRQLVALEPGGRVRWTLARPHSVGDARWSPSGFRIAYLTAGSLRIVAGDGTGDRRLVRSVAPVAPAWRPARGGAHVLAYAGRDGRVHVVVADTNASLWRSPPGETPTQLLWSADGARLAAVGPRSIRVFGAGGRPIRTLPVADARAAAFAGHGRDLALIRAGRIDDQSEVVVLNPDRPGRSERVVFSGSGALGDLAWSPDDRWLLIGWPSADQWLFVRPHGAPRVVAVSDVGRQFSPGAGGRPGFPAVGGWCCPAPPPTPPSAPPRRTPRSR
ncbi:MAG TPA: hypothetical protein VF520_02235 [Thermoleophilaceae bacterium]|jgi:hypothetical protein